MTFLFKNHIYFQFVFFAMGLSGWIFNFDRIIPLTYAILCYVGSAGLVALNIFKLKWLNEKKFKWGLNASIPQLTFYGLLVFLIYFRFFGTGHTGVPVKLFAIIMAATLILDTFMKENKFPGKTTH